MYAEVGEMNEMTMAYFIVLPHISEQLDPDRVLNLQSPNCTNKDKTEVRISSNETGDKDGDRLVCING
jgi:hypothetical protein